MRKEIAVLEKFISEKGLRYTPQREEILKTFLTVEKHLSAEELHKIVKRNNPHIGYVTVYRTMKLFSEAGLCNEVEFGDGILRFEHCYGHQHHDHLICTKCGKFIEVSKPEIEKMQDTLARQHKFMPTRHKLQIFGFCKKCRPRGKR
jgi:Fur family ferric uptake transcriptional regulator